MAAIEENRMNLVWSCTPGSLVHGSFGGYCDRLKGIVTAYYLAKKCGRSFGIEWRGLSRLGAYYSSPYYLPLGWTKLEKDQIFINKIDRLESEDDLNQLMNDIGHISKDIQILISCNQYTGMHWKTLFGQGSMESAFGMALKDILHPYGALFQHQVYQELAAQMRGKEVVGLQIRMGDQDWDRNGAFKVPDLKSICAALSNIKADAVFLVSDSPQWKKFFSEIPDYYNSKKIVMYDYETANIDRSESDKAEKAFPIFLIEHYLLSKCKAIITGDGGGGRTAAWWGGKPLIELC
jgi:hypothetical protein